MTKIAYLMHHGVKGMKWGVRRYQNKDGTLTAEGRAHKVQGQRSKAAWKTKPEVDSIISTMGKEDKEKLGLTSNGDYLTFEDGAYVVKRVLIKDGDTPVAFFDIMDDDSQYNVSLGTRSGKEYRKKGNASKAAKKGMDWYDKNKDRIGDKDIVWGVRTDNEASIKIAKSLDFELDPTSYSDDGRWVNYVRRPKK